MDEYNVMLNIGATDINVEGSGLVIQHQQEIAVHDGGMIKQWLGTYAFSSPYKSPVIRCRYS